MSEIVREYENIAGFSAVIVENKQQHRPYTFRIFEEGRIIFYFRLSFLPEEEIGRELIGTCIFVRELGRREGFQDGRWSLRRDMHRVLGIVSKEVKK